MSAWPMNHCQIRSKIFSGSPKKKAAWRSFSNTKVGRRPGVVSRCQTMNTTASRPTCQTRRYFMTRRVWSSRRELLPVAGEHLLAQHVPDRLVQLDEARRRSHLGHVARPRQVDRELADRMRAW